VTGCPRLSKAPNAATTSGTPPASPSYLGMASRLKIHMNDEVSTLPIRAAHPRRHETSNSRTRTCSSSAFLPQLRLPVYRHQQRRLSEGMLEGLDATMKSADARHYARARPRHPHQASTTIVPYREHAHRVQDKVLADRAGQNAAGRAGGEITAAYDAKVAGGTGSSSDRFITAMYQELNWPREVSSV